MRLTTGFNSFDISARGMSLQKRKMDLIAENLANTDTTKTDEGTVYRRKYIHVTEKANFRNEMALEGMPMNIKRNQRGHFNTNFTPVQGRRKNGVDDNINTEVLEDYSVGDKVNLPDHPDADQEGYVTMPNVDVVHEMVDMITATRSFEANLTAFNSAKQMAKDSLEI